jgi:hypothetical protein
MCRSTYQNERHDSWDWQLARRPLAENGASTVCKLCRKKFRCAMDCHVLLQRSGSTCGAAFCDKRSRRSVNALAEICSTSQTYTGNAFPSLTTERNVCAGVFNSQACSFQSDPITGLHDDTISSRNVLLVRGERKGLPRDAGTKAGRRSGKRRKNCGNCRAGMSVDLMTEDHAEKDEVKPRRR